MEKLEAMEQEETRLPPHGGSGLKFQALRDNATLNPSPSTRREWIEIPGLPTMTRYRHRSPSTRREWIEIYRAGGAVCVAGVSLHTEGVD